MTTAWPLQVLGSAPASLRGEVQRALIASGRFKVHSGEPASDSFVLCLDSEDIACVGAVFRDYSYRYVWASQSSVEEVLGAVQHTAQAPHPGGRFSSTRGANDAATFLSVVREGLAADGGLYILKHTPVIPPSQLRLLCKMKHLTYVELATAIMSELTDSTLTPAMLFPLVLQAYSPERWCELEDICPITPIFLEVTANTAVRDHLTEWRRLMKDVSLMELYHGPTAAFKDFALQLFPRYFNTAINSEHKTRSHDSDAAERDRYIILAATSGDTGVAAISGFVNSQGRSKVMILYPAHGVSAVQQLQMLAFDDGANVQVLAVDSDFDYCQATAKAIFADQPLKERLAALSPAVRLSSANSINWGRLIPQVVFYFWAYRQHVQRAAARSHGFPAEWKMGDPIDVVVPCGNFGNILAGYVARLMGLPIRRLVVAANKNDVLYDFITTGCYDTRKRPLHRTASPSIDILKASNVERFLYLLSDGDTALVASLMSSLEKDGHFTLPEEMKVKMQEVFWAGRCDEDECAGAIKSVFEASGSRRVLDPHTAVAAHVALQYRQYLELESELGGAANKEDVMIPPLIIASTAHWAKFAEPVLRALQGRDMELSTAATSLTDRIHHVRELYTTIQSMGEGVTVHPALAAALEMAERQASSPRTCEADRAAVVQKLEEFAAV